MSFCDIDVVVCVWFEFFLLFLIFFRSKLLVDLGEWARHESADLLFGGRVFMLVVIGLASSRQSRDNLSRRLQFWSFTSCRRGSITAEIELKIGFRSRALASTSAFLARFRLPSRFLPFKGLRDFEILLIRLSRLLNVLLPTWAHTKKKTQKTRSLRFIGCWILFSCEISSFIQSSWGTFPCASLSLSIPRYKSRDFQCQSAKSS